MATTPATWSERDRLVQLVNGATGQRLNYLSEARTALGLSSTGDRNLGKKAASALTDDASIKAYRAKQRRPATPEDAVGTTGQDCVDVLDQWVQVTTTNTPDGFRLLVQGIRLGSSGEPVIDGIDRGANARARVRLTSISWWSRA